MSDRLSLKKERVPSIVGHSYKPLRVHTLDYLKRETAIKHKRLTVFHHKGVKCANPKCHREGAYVIIAQDPGGGIHADVYTTDFILMTVDHINPKSNGGGEELENKQPMCEPCNSSKGCKVPIEHIKK